MNEAEWTLTREFDDGYEAEIGIGVEGDRTLRKNLIVIYDPDGGEVYRRRFIAPKHGVERIARREIRKARRQIRRDNRRSEITPVSELAFEYNHAQNIGPAVANDSDIERLHPPSRTYEGSLSVDAQELVREIGENEEESDDSDSVSFGTPLRDVLNALRGDEE